MMSPTIFLAHASEDAEKVRELHARFMARGYDPWLDKVSLRPGEEWDRVIQNQIEISKFCVICLSKSSALKTGYVQKEFRCALDAVALRPPGQIYLLPLRIDDCEVPDLKINGVRLRALHVVDLFADEGYQQLFDVIDDSIVPEHPPERVGDWHPQLNDCEFTIDQHYDRTNLWGDFSDVLVHIKNAPKGGRAYLMPSGRVPAMLRSRRDLTDPNSLAPKVRRRATLKFIGQPVRTRPIKGKWFYVRPGTSNEAKKVYANSYDSILIEQWNGEQSQTS